MRTVYLFMIYILLFPLRLSDTFPSYYVLWNVGQGQWWTYIHNNYCFHVDAGGEKAPLGQLDIFCKTKRNFFSLSHWDTDHINFIPRLAKRWKYQCLIYPLLGDGQPKKRQWLSTLPLCKKEELSLSDHLISLYPRNDPKLFQKHKIQEHKKFKIKSNDLSRVVIFQSWLLPGDSPIAAEKIWSQSQLLKSVEYFVLGHHGSRTSTSQLLLKKLPHVKMAFSSARYKRYRHPHFETESKMNQLKIPLIRTEDWGHLILRAKY